MSRQSLAKAHQKIQELSWEPQYHEPYMQPMWSQSDSKPPTFEDSLDRAKNRFAGICSDLGLDVPEELKQ